MMMYPFHEDKNTAVITCSHIVEKKEPVLYVSHDAEDGMWQFLCGKEHEESEARIISLEEMFQSDQSIGTLKDLPVGYEAIRKSTFEEWTIRKIL